MPLKPACLQAPKILKPDLGAVILATLERSTVTASSHGQASTSSEDMQLSFCPLVELSWMRLHKMLFACSHFKTALSFLMVPPKEFTDRLVDLLLLRDIYRYRALSIISKRTRVLQDLTIAWRIRSLLLASSLEPPAQASPERHHYLQFCSKRFAAQLVETVWSQLWHVRLVRDLADPAGCDFMNLRKSRLYMICC